MARFFIDRPIFAWVIAIIIMVGGIFAIRTLPVSQYPKIAPPAITINASYPGASAKTIEDSVTQVIEQRMNGLDGLRYMEATSDSAGNATITLTFNQGTDPDIAQVQVQNKLSTAMQTLPTEVQQLGLKVSKSVRNFLMLVGVRSTDGSMTNIDIGDYVASKLQDPISRVPGVGELQVFGSQYSMRIWLDAYKLANFGLMPSDVSSAIKSQNAQVSAGQLAAMPALPGQRLNATISAKTRYEDKSQFENILIKVNKDGSQVRLRDVARVELGGESYATVSHSDRMPSSGIAIRPATGANALETVAAIRAKVDELKAFMPAGLEVVYPMDTTPFVRLSIEEVVKTLVEAIILVFLVMYLFLQNVRATLIPTIAVPVVLLGTFGVMSFAGFSINTLTLFGVVLAIGLLVDDAIVVVENVERLMTEEHLSPKEATKKSMAQITGALVGITMVLSAVFIPMAFFAGSTGVIYRQFSITIVSAMVLSVLVAMILTPALCSTILKPLEPGALHQKRGFFGWFNAVFDKGAERYTGFVGRIIRARGRSIVAYLLIVAGMVYLFKITPKAFLPDEDQGILYAQAQLPPGSTTEQSLAVLDRMEKHFLEDEKDSVETMFGVTGFSYAGSGQNQVFCFVRLRDWEDRKRADQKVRAIQMRALMKFGRYKDAIAVAFAPPAVFELGNASGFDLRLTDNGNLGHEALIAARSQLVALAAADPRVRSVRANGLDDTAQLNVVIDEEKAAALGLSLSDVNSTLSSALGASYVNDFLDQGRVKKVYLQSEAAYRMRPEDIGLWHVRNKDGDMVPLSSFTRVTWSLAAPKLERFDGIASVAIAGEPAPGVSSGEALAAMQELAAKLPAGIGLRWAGLSYEEQLSGSQGTMLYAVSLLIVFLCLAALYESWSIPISVLFIVPLGVVGTLLAAYFRSMSNDVYFQVGLLTIVGLSAKNAILIVEFAKESYDHGMGLTDAVLLAARQRLRPILMTSLAFGLGVLPLALSTGAGSGSQNAIGTGVVGGTITATALGILFVPLFFVVILQLFRVKPVTAPAASSHVVNGSTSHE